MDSLMSQSHQRGSAGAISPLLPNEIIFAIIEAPVPLGTSVILKSSSPITATLVAWSRVCHATRHLATSLLRQHCAYIDCPRKLIQLAGELTEVDLPPFLSRGGPITRLFLYPFENPDYDEEEEDINPYPSWDTCDETWRPGLEDAAYVKAVSLLLAALAPCLKQFVCEMYLSRYGGYPADPYQHVRPVLRSGLSTLYNLEEFTSVRDALHLDAVGEGDGILPPVWAVRWPRLRRLSLCQVDMSKPGFFTNLARMPNLERLTLVAPYGMYDRTVFKSPPPLHWGQEAPLTPQHRGIDVKQKWFDALARTEAYGTAPESRPERLVIMFIEEPGDIPDFSFYSQAWQKLDPDGRLEILAHAEMVAPFGDPTYQIQETVKAKATAGWLHTLKPWMPQG